jgi:hypothetical protein
LHSSRGEVIRRVARCDGLAPAGDCARCRCDQDRTWRIDWELSLPVAEGKTHTEKVVARISLQAADTQGETDSALVRAFSATLDEACASLCTASSETEWRESGGDASANQDEA